MTKVILLVAEVPIEYQSLCPSGTSFRHKMGQDLARKAVAILYNCDAEQIEIFKSTLGRPRARYIPENAITPVSITHVSRYVAVASTLNVSIKIGMDIEHVDRFQNANEKLISSILSVKEHNALGSITKENIAEVWTAKEAYVKALGTGFQDRPACYELPYNNFGKTSVLSNGQVWRCDMFPIEEGYKMAVGMLSKNLNCLKSATILVQNVTV